MSEYIVASRDELLAIPTDKLTAIDLAIIETRGPNGEFWGSELNQWNGTKWVYVAHGDPPGKPGTMGLPGYPVGEPVGGWDASEFLDFFLLSDITMAKRKKLFSEISKYPIPPTLIQELSDVLRVNSYHSGKSFAITNLPKWLKSMEGEPHDLS